MESYNMDDLKNVYVGRFLEIHGKTDEEVIGWLKQEFWHEIAVDLYNNCKKQMEVSKRVALSDEEFLEIFTQSINTSKTKSTNKL